MDQCVDKGGSPIVGEVGCKKMDEPSSLALMTTMMAVGVIMMKLAMNDREDEVSVSQR